MKRINLVPKEPLFPLSISHQKKIIYPLVLLIVVFYSYSFYKAKIELNKLNLTISNLKADIEQLKNTVTEKNIYLQKSINLEKEFLTIKEDYEILKKNMHIKNIIYELTGLVPSNLWLTSISYLSDSQKVITITGRSLKKEDIFLFLNNCSNIGKNPELIEINSEDNSYIFSIKIEMI